MCPQKTKILIKYNVTVKCNILYVQYNSKTFHQNIAVNGRLDIVLL